MVVLATGMEPASKIPGASYTDEGFALSGVGMFATGCAKKPARCGKSVQDATGAALKALQIGKGEVSSTWKRNMHFIYARLLHRGIRKCRKNVHFWRRMLLSSGYKNHFALCGKEGVDLIRTTIATEGVNTLILAACSARVKFEEFRFPGCIVERSPIRELAVWTQEPNSPGPDGCRRLHEDVGCKGPKGRPSGG